MLHENRAIIQKAKSNNFPPSKPPTQESHKFSHFHCHRRSWIPLWLLRKMAQDLSTTRYNPYDKRLHQQNCENEPLAANATNINTSSFLSSNEMGIQSQLRNGSIKACKARATQAKHAKPQVQRSIEGGVAFVPRLHCKTCYTERLELMGKKGVTKSHKHHDVRCPRNRKTKGMSQQSVFVNKETDRNVF